MHVCMYTGVLDIFKVSPQRLLLLIKQEKVMFGNRELRPTRP